jgi:hypothetical protein
VDAQPVGEQLDLMVNALIVLGHLSTVLAGLTIASEAVDKITDADPSLAPEIGGLNLQLLEAAEQGARMSAFISARLEAARGQL